MYKQVCWHFVRVAWYRVPVGMDFQKINQSAKKRFVQNSGLSQISKICFSIPSLSPILLKTVEIESEGGYLLYKSCLRNLIRIQEGIF